MSSEDQPKVDVGFDTDDLEKLIYWTMPFGRFRGTTLIDLPEEYLMWFERSEYPAGELGRLMQLCLGIKLSGTDGVVKDLRTLR